MPNEMEPLTTVDIKNTDKETNPADTIEIGLANTLEDNIGRLSLVTERYTLEGYLDDVKEIDTDLEPSEIITRPGFQILKDSLSKEDFESFMETGIVLKFPNKQKLYIDKYHWNSVPFFAKSGKDYIGSARLIIKNGYGLPTSEDPQIKIYENWKETAKKSIAEFSQFAVKKGASPAKVSVGLLREAYQYSKKVNIDAWLATIDDNVKKFLNGRFFNFGLPQIGETVRYLGSNSTPIFIDLEKSLSNAESIDSSKEMARYIRE